MDFIWMPRSGRPIAIECKWSSRDFDPGNLAVFARAYPKAELTVVTTDAEPPFAREYDGYHIRFFTLENLMRHLASKPGGIQHT